MSLTLILFRHAKSSWSDPDLADFDRPLNDRGQQAAPRMGEWLKEERLVPDLVLVSAARRTRDTWTLAAPALEGSVPVRVESDLYHADPSVILDRIRSTGTGVRRLMVIGHNPGLETLARGLVEEGRKKQLRRMYEKFPTSAVAVIDFSADEWASIEPGTGTLRAFVRPKDLVNKNKKKK